MTRGDIRRVLGLDVSLQHTGVCLYTLGDPESMVGCEIDTTTVQDPRVIPASKKVKDRTVIEGLERLEYIFRHVAAYFQPGTLVMLEHFAFGARGNAVYELAGLGYLIRFAMKQRGIPYIEVSPTSLKKFVSGTGKDAKKELVLLDTKERFDVRCETNNVADATVLQFMGRALLGEPMPKPLVKFQQEALKTVLDSLKDPLTDCQIAREIFHPDLCLKAAASAA